MIQGHRSFVREKLLLEWHMAGLPALSRAHSNFEEDKEGLFSGQTQAAAPELPGCCYSELKQQAGL